MRLRERKRGREGGGGAEHSNSSSGSGSGSLNSSFGLQSARARWETTGEEVYAGLGTSGGAEWPKLSEYYTCTLGCKRPAAAAAAPRFIDKERRRRREEEDDENTFDAFDFKASEPFHYFVADEYLASGVSQLWSRGRKWRNRSKHHGGCAFANRLASSLQQFVPEHLLNALDAEERKYAGYAGRGNRLDVATSHFNFSDSDDHLLALFPRGEANENLSLSLFQLLQPQSLQGREGGGGGGEGDNSGNRHQLSAKHACDAFLDLNTPIQEVKLGNYALDFQQNGGMLFAARTDSHIFCGSVEHAGSSKEAKLSLLFDIKADAPAIPSHVCFSPYWPELCYGTHCGKLSVVNIERLGGMGRGESGTLAKNLLEGFQSSSATFELMKNPKDGRKEVYQVYGMHPKTVICCVDNLIKRVDLRSLSSATVHKNTSTYTCIDRGTAECGLFGVLSANEIQLFDERYMKPLISWKTAFQDGHLLSMVTRRSIAAQAGVADSLCNEGGMIVASGKNLSKSACYPFVKNAKDGSQRRNPSDLMLDVPTSTAVGPGALLQHCKDQRFRPAEAMKWMDAMHRAGTRTPVKSELPEPKSCVGLKILAAPSGKGFLTCSLASNFGLSISCTQVAGEERSASFTPKRNVVTSSPYNSDAAGGETTELVDPETEAGSWNRVNLQGTHAYVKDISSYQDLRKLVGRVNCEASKPSQGYPHTVYELLKTSDPNSTTLPSSFDGVPKFHPRDTLRQKHHSHLIEKYQSKCENAEQVELMSTVFDLDQDTFFQLDVSQNTGGGGEFVQKLLEKDWSSRKS